MNTYNEYASGTGLWLYDKNGVAMLAVHKKLDVIDITGTVCNEETMGTSAHVLAIIHKQPVQLIGSEHYLSHLYNAIGSAAPIMDSDGELLGVLGLTHWIDDFFLEQYSGNVHIHSLGWISALAAAIEKQIQLLKTNQELSNTNKALIISNAELDATLTFIDEGIITIDRNGRIINCNQEGARIFGLQPYSIKNKNIFDLPTGKINFEKPFKGRK
ncbi:MAG: PAS domain-containing protein [Desulfitobacteriia bacterium]